MIRGKPAIEAQNLTVSYGAVPALLDVSLSIPEGTLVGIIGPNGSGKSTLIKSILGFLRPDVGQVRIYGEPAEKARGRVAYVPQRGSVDWDFPVTVRDVALMGRYGHVSWWRDLSRRDHQLAMESLAMVRMDDLADRQIGQLSGGQQQRVFMARAMAQGAEILLLDEPFAGVDAATERAILDVLERTKQSGRTLLVVHHDLATAAEYFDLLVLLKQRLFAFGPPEAVLQPELLAEVYEGKLRAFANLRQTGTAMLELLRDLFVRPLSEPAFQKALIGGSLVAIVSGVIGCFVILRRMAFLGDALSHSMLAGVTAGYLFMQIVFGIEAHAPAMMVGSVVAGFVTVALVGFVSRVSRIKDDTAIGIMYTGIFAVGGVLASLFSHRIHLDLFHFITGMVLGVEDQDLWMMAIIASVVLSVVILLYRHLLITTFDPVMAASIGIPVLAIDYLLTTCTSLVVVGAVSIVGVILVVGLLVTPAATAYLLSDRLHRMMTLAALFGVTGVVGGLFVSLWIGNIATGPSIVIVSTIQFLVVLAASPKYGLVADWLRRRSMIPQQTIEDILGSFRYADESGVSVTEISQLISHRSDEILRAVKSMIRNDLLEEQGTRITLTAAGRQEAKRILRAHRLWETYLQHLGTPTAELHERAHELEHLHDEETVDYLDDKLGHPLRDPHGAVIPEDFVHLVPGAQVKSSLLREGRQGVVIELDQTARDMGLRVGMRITAGPRSSDGQQWSFVLPNQTRVQMGHEDADTVIVKLQDGGEGE